MGEKYNCLHFSLFNSRRRKIRKRRGRVEMANSIITKLKLTWEFSAIYTHTQNSLVRLEITINLIEPLESLTFTLHHALGSLWKMKSWEKEKGDRIMGKLKKEIPIKNNCYRNCYLSDFWKDWYVEYWKNVG